MRKAAPIASAFFLAVGVLGTSPEAVAAQRRIGEFDVGRFDFCESRQANADLLVRVDSQADQAHPSIRKSEEVIVALVRDGIAIAEGLPDPAHCRSAFKSGHGTFRELLASRAAAVRRSQPFEPTDDQQIRRARLDLLGQWIQEEAARQVLLSLPSDSQDPAMQWATAQANARMKIVAIDSALVVSLVYEEFGAPEPAELGKRAAWQAKQLSERYGIPASMRE